MKNLFKAILLSFVFAIISNSYAQVGIGTSDPNQELDVNGKIKIGTDGRTPTNGTMRYNPTQTDFEGYAGGQWKSFTTNGSNIPSNPQFVYSREGTGLSSDGMRFRDMSGNLVIDETVPPGKFLIVTHINISPLITSNYSSGTPIYRFSIQFGNSFSPVSQRIDVRGRYEGGHIYKETAAYAPLGIVPGGQTLRVINTTFGPGEIGDCVVNVTGFLVDDLSFD